ncbi:Ada metal-binding domain-containing protein [Pectinatus haikarae]|uniref:AraC family transcriptional regulator of adaptative response / methylphosphotriester-DNA alkyltransferase methyltransferase n=2 Tax=Pectinatus haikarae TaxID=349096 RepID=A0ABT9Y685_9FIRM|nr:AraC family transcriptional regulator of adaptative response / methylphosphotriester-DNA alkyltransferase methyltransferase [Pectinatus haikarae]
MTEEEKWEAVLACDASYNNKFFYGVKTTGIFCRPSCKSKNPKRENIIFFTAEEQARKSGFRPCKRCRPDLLEFRPHRENAEKIRLTYDRYFGDHVQLKKELEKLCLGRNQIIQLFQHHYKKTPVKYLKELRIANAKILLSDTQNTILQVALQSGFNSISTFYAQFDRLVGISPNAYRKKFSVRR